MSPQHSRFNRRRSSWYQPAQSLVELVLLLTFLAIVGIGAASITGRQVSSVVQKTSCGLSSAPDAGCPARTPAPTVSPTTTATGTATVVPTSTVTATAAPTSTTTATAAPVSTATATTAPAPTVTPTVCVQAGKSDNCKGGPGK